jgi:hypothetical protein
MSTLAEIEAAAARLNSAELEQLERRVHELAVERRGATKVFTGADAARWWREREPLPADESAAFADDIEAARHELNRPPRENPWA